MLIGELLGEALGVVLRILGWLFFELLFELVIKGSGSLVIRLVRPSAEPGDTACAIVGVLFWMAVGSGGFFLYRAVSA